MEDFVLFNPTEKLKKGVLAKKISMDALKPFTRKISFFSVEEFNGGTKFRNGDTIMARITPCLENGKTAMVDILETEEVAFGSTEYIVLRAIPGKSDPFYLYYLFRSNFIRNVAIKSMVGSSGRQRVQIDVLKNLEIDLPDIKTQEKIGKALFSFDAAIENNNEIKENVKKQIKALFEKTFLNPEANQGWEKDKIGNYISLERGFSYKGKYLVESGDTAMINLGNILPNSVFREEKLKFYSGDFSNKHIVKKGDIVVANTDLTQDREVLGSAVFVPELGYKTMIASHHLSIVRNIRISKYFLFGLLNTPVFRERVSGFATGTTVLALPADALLNCEFKVPPVQLIEGYDEQVKPMFQYLESIENKNKKLSKLRDELVLELITTNLQINNKSGE